MSEHVICTGGFEPSAFWKDGATQTAFVQLNFDVVAGDSGHAEAQFKLFLDSLPMVQFYLYKLLPGAGPNVRLEAVNDAGGQPRLFVADGPDPVGRRAEILEWIEARRDGNRSAHLWVTPAEPADGSFRDEAALSVSQLLATAESWHAPLAQDAGLTRILEIGDLGDPDPDARWIVLPFFAGGMPEPHYDAQVEEAEADNHNIVFAYNAGTGFAAAQARVRPLAPHVDDPTLLVDPETGFLLVDPDAGETHRLIERIGQRSGSLLAPAPHLKAPRPSEPLWPEIEDTAQDGPQRRTRRLVWRAMNGLLTLLDPLLLALTMGGRSPEGPFLAELMWIAEGKEFDDLDTTGLVAAISKSLLSGIRIAPADEADKAKRAAYAARLTHLFHLADPNPSPDSEKLLPRLLALYVEHDPTQLPEISSENPEQQLDIELAEQLQTLESEGGIEAMALALLREIGDVAGALRSMSTPPADPDGTADRILAALEKRFDTLFNGLDATRLALGGLVASELTRALSGGGAMNHETLAVELRKTDWFASRFGLVAIGGALDPLAKALPVAATTHLVADDAAALSASMARAFSGIIDELLEQGTGQPARFVPETLPRSVPVQLAVDGAVDDGDTFPLQYDGIALLVRREGDWTYANLEKLQVGGADVDGLSILPLQPLPIDGQRRLFFEYQGTPLAADGYEPPDQEAMRTPYFKFDAPNAGQIAAAGMKKLPALAYGHSYAIAAHAVSRGGSLPGRIRGTTPWSPRAMPEVPAEDAGPPARLFARTFDYSRTTAIGRVTIEERPAGSPRFNAAVPGVEPLFLDYPRVGFGAPAGQKARIDLWRNADGSGAIALSDTGVKTDAILADARSLGGPATLKLWAVDDPAAIVDVESAPHWTIAISAPFEQGRLTLSIEGVNPRVLKLATDGVGWKVTGPAEFQAAAGTGLGDTETLWIHAELTAGAKPNALGFADLRAGSSSETGRPADESEPHLFVTPKDDGNKAIWIEGLANPIRAEIPFPRVGYFDFDRWMGHQTQFEEAAGGAGNQARLKDFLADLIVHRTLDEDLEKYDHLLNALPDPAVDQLLVELTMIDHLEGANTQEVIRTKRIAVPRLGTYLQHADGGGKDRLAYIDAHHRAELIVDPDADALHLEIDEKKGRPSIRVGLPRGTVARLSVRPLVAKRYFEATPPVIDRRIAQWVVGGDATHHLFAGAGLIIEKARPFALDEATTLHWSQLAAEMIEVRPADTQRRYDLAVRNARSATTYAHWRELGSAEVRTQGWRFTGRPIYAWFAPKEMSLGRIDNSPVAWIARGAETATAHSRATDANGSPGQRAAFDAFERDAFFERDPRDTDAHRQKLEPLRPPVDKHIISTVLQSFAWEKPSATMFRHKLRLCGRYAGAMNIPIDAEVEVTTPKSELGLWIRVAMLADQSKLPMTRPQLRAMLPLTNAPDSGLTPPILALIEEPPLGQGGLAERIASEIRTGFGYELISTLGILDSRKEFGPDPRLSYQATDADTALQIVLRPEGPVGLTFDTSSAPAPAYVNSAYVLAPGPIGTAGGVDESLEEHFLSVALRRYLDSGWVTDDKSVAAAELAPDQPWWIDIDRKFTLSAELVEASTRKEADVIVEGAVLTKPVLAIEKDVAKNTWVISAAAEAILAEARTKPIPVAKVPLNIARNLRLLHQPLEDGRAALCVFAVPDRASVARGISGAPLLVASFEWSSGGKRLVNLRLSHSATARPASASPATALNWTRTGRNSDLVHAAPLAPDISTQIAVADLQIVRNDGGFAVSETRTGIRWLRPSTSTYAWPLYVHRHFALLTTHAAGGLGHALELNDGACLMAGIDAPVQGTGSGRQGRLIEFEVPARPLGAGPIHADFKRAVFDIKAILRADAPTPEALAFWIRPLAGAKMLARSGKLSLRMRLPGTDSQPAADWKVELEAPATWPAAGVEMHSLMFALRFASPAVPAIFASLVDTKGVRHEIKAALPDALPDVVLTNVEAITLDSVEASTNDIVVNDEWWADVSMLTLRKMPAANDPIPFAFEWLFTGSGQAPNAAVSSEALRRMVEAEARIISVSPPIAVMD